MIRKLLNTVIETALQPIDSILYPNTFSKKETVIFEWLKSFSPCFPIIANNIKILTEPEQFYSALLSNCKSATERITLASLYLGTGNLEENLVQAIQNNKTFKTGELKVNILLDYTRGSRFENNSRIMLLPLLQNENIDCQVSLYHTPVLRGLLKKYIPNRWNELFGLQHMKLYIFDNTMIISGANLSNDYFTNRQDRYFVVEDKNLCDFYCGLVNKVQKFSLKMDKNNELGLHDGWKLSPFEGDQEQFIDKAGDLIERFLLDTKEEHNRYRREGFDTWIFPTVQIGQLGIHHDERITKRLFEEVPSESRLKIATGYFNLTDQYMRTLIEDNKANCDILMAHPKANGFLGAKGLAGGIPYAYSFIAKMFKKQLVMNRQESRINLMEYLRDDWTYHAKGLWYYAPSSKYPCMTVIGSPNFGERSVKRDIETQIVIITENDDLKQRLHAECCQLYKQGLPAEVDRNVPEWVKAFVFFCRSYF